MKQELEAIQQFKNLYKTLKGRDIDEYELTKVLVHGMDYDETYEELIAKCKEVGRMTSILTHARAELFFYQKRYGRIDIWNEIFEMRKRLELN